MKEFNFKEELNKSNSFEIQSSFNQIFETIFGEGINIKRFEKDNLAQQGFKTDLIITTKKGRKYSIDEKTRRFSYLGTPDYPLEIIHHRYNYNQILIKSIPGWLYSSTADLIAFGTKNLEGNKIIEICIFDLNTFKNENFKKIISSLRKVSAKTNFINEKQITINALINLQIIKDNSKYFEYRRLE